MSAARLALIALVAHEVNRAYCVGIGDASQPAWGDAPAWQKDSAVAGAQFVLTNPESTPEASHASWLAQKAADGWIYGAIKDPEVKTHPCFLPYEQLPVDQRVKDYLFGAAVRASAHILQAAADCAYASTALQVQVAGEVWLSHSKTPHFAVKQFDTRDEVGIIYRPDGTQLVYGGDTIVQDGEAYAVSKIPATATQATLDDDIADLSATFAGIDVNALDVVTDPAAPDGDRTVAFDPATQTVYVTPRSDAADTDAPALDDTTTTQDGQAAPSVSALDKATDSTVGGDTTSQGDNTEQEGT